MYKHMEDIRKKSDAELVGAIRDARESLRLFRFKAAGASARNSKEGRTLRAMIARLLTEQHIRASSTTASQ